MKHTQETQTNDKDAHALMTFQHLSKKSKRAERRVRKKMDRKRREH